jgi:hypothetical protein
MSPLEPTGRIGYGAQSFARLILFRRFARPLPLASFSVAPDPHRVPFILHARRPAHRRYAALAELYGFHDAPRTPYQHFGDPIARDKFAGADLKSLVMQSSTAVTCTTRDRAADFVLRFLTEDPALILACGLPDIPPQRPERLVRLPCPGRPYRPLAAAPSRRPACHLVLRRVVADQELRVRALIEMASTLCNRAHGLGKADAARLLETYYEMIQEIMYDELVYVCEILRFSTRGFVKNFLGFEEVKRMLDVGAPGDG